MLHMGHGRGKRGKACFKPRVRTKLQPGEDSNELPVEARVTEGLAHLLYPKWHFASNFEKSYHSDHCYYIYGKK